MTGTTLNCPITSGWKLKEEVEDFEGATVEEKCENRRDDKFVSGGSKAKSVSSTALVSFNQRRFVRNEFCTWKYINRGFRCF